MKIVLFLIPALATTLGGIAFQIGLATGHFRSFEWAMPYLWTTCAILWLLWLFLAIRHHRKEGKHSPVNPIPVSQQQNANPTMTQNVNVNLPAQAIAPPVGDRELRAIIRKHLYEELSSNYEAVISRLAISSSIEGIKQGTAHRFREKLNLSFQMRNQHSEIHKEVFWSLPDIQVIDRLYTSFSHIGNSEDEYQARTTALRAAAEFEQAVVVKKLDHDLLKEICSPVLWQYLEDIVEGRNKGARAAINPF